ncbi:hypothetical protein D8674_032927 [Pyrus ussuriensis x Pyrus communis]|uniref:Uncharacterized protein n=1 Tax=Pyrus ussuriensis x Pyrus communis TaxID=2448454 RepID=A0A5N5HPQ4_9ROSA|nr:hypothetical protein D8674_032927 [Pyrus ussuriensis x Pyrus communis]
MISRGFGPLLRAARPAAEWTTSGVMSLPSPKRMPQFALAALIERVSYEENYGGKERRVPEPARTISSSAFPSMDSPASQSISSLTLFTIS